MQNPRSRRRATTLSATVGAAVVLAVAPSTAAFAATEIAFEEQASANWSVAHTCSDGAVVEARLLVETTRDFRSPSTEDVQPTVRVQYLAVCPDGTSFGWAGFIGDDRPLEEEATITSAPDLVAVQASGTGTARDNSGVDHQVTFDVAWTGVGGLDTEVTTFTGFRTLIHTEKERAATATGTVTFDGAVLVDGDANHVLTPEITTEEDKSIVRGRA